MPSSLPWPRGRRGLASRSRWKPCTFFTSRKAFLKNQPSYCLPPDSAEPGRLLLPPSQILSPGTPTRHRHFSSKARSFTARGPFRLGTGTLARTPKNKTRRGGFWSSAVALLGLARRATVRRALVPATVAIVIHSTAAENKGRNGHGESDFHAGAFHRVACNSLRALLLGACKPLLATLAWMRLHHACMWPLTGPPQAQGSSAPTFRPRPTRTPCPRNSYSQGLSDLHNQPVFARKQRPHNKLK